MTRATASDRKALAAEVRDHIDEVRRQAAAIGVADLRLGDDGTVVMHSDAPGYGQVIDLSRRLSSIVGCYVHVITDDVPAAADAKPL